MHFFCMRFLNIILLTRKNCNILQNQWLSSHSDFTLSYKMMESIVCVEISRNAAFFMLILYKPKSLTNDKG